jgi:chaperonin GroES
LQSQTRNSFAARKISVEIKKMSLSNVAVSNVVPLHDRILVTRLEAKDVGKSGIIIPDSAKEKPQEGEVVAVGLGKIEKGNRVPIDVKVGDRILFGKYTGNEITVDDREYLILREEEVLAKLGSAKAAVSSKK